MLVPFSPYVHLNQSSSTVWNYDWDISEELKFVVSFLTSNPSGNTPLYQSKDMWWNLLVTSFRWNLSFPFLKRNLRFHWELLNCRSSSRLVWVVFTCLSGENSPLDSSRRDTDSVRWGNPVHRSEVECPRFCLPEVP